MYGAAFKKQQNFNPRSCERSDYTTQTKEVPPEQISIHAPARGATIIVQCDISDIAISIHAPARGATKSSSKSDNAHCNFNPRSCERSDAKIENYFIDTYLFQSTLLREERLHQQGELAEYLDFNPRSCERSDHGLRAKGE